MYRENSAAFEFWENRPWYQKFRCIRSLSCWFEKGYVSPEIEKGRREEKREGGRGRQRGRECESEIGTHREKKQQK